MNLFPVYRSQIIRTGSKRGIFLGPVPEKENKKFLAVFECFEGILNILFSLEKKIFFQLKKK